MAKIYRRHTILSKNSTTKTNLSQKIFGGSTVLLFDLSQRDGVKTQPTLKKIFIVFHLRQNVVRCLSQCGRLSSFSRFLRVWATQARVIVPGSCRDAIPKAHAATWSFSLSSPESPHLTPGSKRRVPSTDYVVSTLCLILFTYTVSENVDSMNVVEKRAESGELLGLNFFMT